MLFEATMRNWFKKADAGASHSEALDDRAAPLLQAEPADPPSPRPEPATGGGLFGRLRRRLGKTQASLAGRIRSAIGLKAKVDEALLEQIEEILIEGDVGVRAASAIVERLRVEGRRREASDSAALTRIVRDCIEQILTAGHRTLDLAASHPTIVLVVGVNGTGKTTTIGKLALELKQSGKSVMLVAADTFRAAAIEQLAIWAERTGARLVSKEQGADPASVCFEALTVAKDDPPDAILIDTAGRLHTKTYLMDELGKLVRVIRKLYPDAPHETVLVLDATTGQNALQQVATFNEVAELTGLIMTKLDGTAKGGILIAIKEAHPDLPIYKIGIGEAPEDLRDFNAAEFAEALFGEGS